MKRLIPLILLTSAIVACGDKDDTSGDSSPPATEEPGSEEVLDYGNNAGDEVTDTGETGSTDTGEPVTDSGEPDVVYVTVYLDADEDGWGSGTAYEAPEDNIPPGYVEQTGDCDDSDPAVHPDAEEICDEVDNDCDYLIDADDDSISADELELYFEDADEDGWGTGETYVFACSQPDGYATTDSDCDDTDDSIHPNGAEYCDGVDSDCDGVEDPDDAIDASSWYGDVDGDGWGNPDDITTACSQPDDYVSNQDDCDDTDADLNEDDADGDGVSTCEDDCDDGDSSISAEATYCLDADGDGYTDPDDCYSACSSTPTGSYTSGPATDCDDLDDGINPDAEEVCDGVDNDCDELIDMVESEDTGDTGVYDLDCEGDCDTGCTDTGDTDADDTGSSSDDTGSTDTGDSGDDSDDTGTADTGDSDTGDTDADDTGSSSDDTGGSDTGCEATTWFLDSDGDGLGDAEASTESCDEPDGYVNDDTDCDDADSTVGAPSTWYADADEDGYGDPSNTTEDCDEPDGYVENAEDCDDTTGLNSPVATEVADDGVDNDCDGDVDSDDTDAEFLVEFTCSDEGTGSTIEITLNGDLEFGGLMSSVTGNVTDVSFWAWEVDASAAYATESYSGDGYDVTTTSFPIASDHWTPSVDTDTGDSAWANLQVFYTNDTSGLCYVSIDETGEGLTIYIDSSVLTEDEADDGDSDGDTGDTGSFDTGIGDTGDADTGDTGTDGSDTGTTDTGSIDTGSGS